MPCSRQRAAPTTASPTEDDASPTRSTWPRRADRARPRGAALPRADGQHRRRRARAVLVCHGSAAQRRARSLTPQTPRRAAARGARRRRRACRWSAGTSIASADVGVDGRRLVERRLDRHARRGACQARTGRCWRPDHGACAARSNDAPLRGYDRIRRCSRRLRRRRRRHRRGRRRRRRAGRRPAHDRDRPPVAVGRCPAATTRACCASPPNLGIALATDGVGSKLVVAEQTGRLETVGIDCVAMNVNDLICVGAEPIALVDYLAVEEADPELLARIGVGLKRRRRGGGRRDPRRRARRAARADPRPSLAARLRPLRHGDRHGRARRDRHRRATSRPATR